MWHGTRPHLSLLAHLGRRPRHPTAQPVYCAAFTLIQFALVASARQPTLSNLCLVRALCVPAAHYSKISSPLKHKTTRINTPLKGLIQFSTQLNVATTADWTFLKICDVASALRLCSRSCRLKEAPRPLVWPRPGHGRVTLHGLDSSSGDEAPETETPLPTSQYIKHIVAEQQRNVNTGSFIHLKNTDKSIKRKFEASVGWFLDGWGLKTGSDPMKAPRKTKREILLGVLIGTLSNVRAKSRNFSKELKEKRHPRFAQLDGVSGFASTLML